MFVFAHVSNTMDYTYTGQGKKAGLAFFRVGEDTFEMYLRYRYRYMRGCIFCIFRYFGYRYH